LAPALVEVDENEEHRRGNRIGALLKAVRSKLETTNATAPTAAADEIRQAEC
jgi:hypothetical protein